MKYGIYQRDRIEKSVKGVLFDMDGVILDTEKLYCRFWREAAQALGYSMTEEQALGMRSLNPEAGQKKLESYFGPGVSREAMKRKRVELMDAYVAVHGVEAKPGIYRLLDALQARGLRTAIVTSSPVERAKRYLEPLGLWDRFSCVCSGNSVPHGKPEPDIYRYGASCVGLHPYQCIAIEDSHAGILSAHRAGCLEILVPDLGEPERETLEITFAVCKSLEDVIEIVDTVSAPAERTEPYDPLENALRFGLPLTALQGDER